MTTADLIAELSKLPPDTSVLVDAYEFGVKDPVCVRKIRVALDVSDAGHGGPHAEIPEDDWMVNDTVPPPVEVDAVLISRNGP